MKLGLVLTISFQSDPATLKRSCRNLSHVPIHFLIDEKDRKAFTNIKTSLPLLWKASRRTHFWLLRCSFEPLSRRNKELLDRCEWVDAQIHIDTEWGIPRPTCVG